MLGKRVAKKQLDPQLCFEVWLETGSVYKAPLVLRDKHGLYNDRTGRAFTQEGVWRAAWNYALTNMDTARVLVSRVWRSNGMELTDKDWYTMVVKRARYLYPQKKYRAFLDANIHLQSYV